MAGWIKVSPRREVGLGPSDTVLDGDPVFLPKKGTQPPSIFGSCLLWPNGWMDQDATWYGLGLGSGHIMLDGDPTPPKRGTASNFRPMSTGWMSTAGWIKMALGMEVGLDPGHIVLDGDSSI